MTYTEIIARLQSSASERYRANVIKLGIPEENSIGVSTAEIRKLAKEIGKSNDLARELWQTGYHEAKLLAVLVFDPKTFPLTEAEFLIAGVASWDLCDHLCKNLLLKIKGYEKLIEAWCPAEETYRKRAAFTLMSAAAVHEKKISDGTLDQYLQWIAAYSDDNREHVKKAVSWALREIGKKNFTYQEKAILLAREWIEGGSKAQAWIAKDALRELENLVKVEGRERLISAKSQMGREEMGD